MLYTGVQDVARLMVLGAALAQMPAWYVSLSYGQALEAAALLADLPVASNMRFLEDGTCTIARAVFPCRYFAAWVVCDRYA